MNLELLRAIVILPGTALVFVPGAVMWLGGQIGAAMAVAGPAQPRLWFALMLGGCGFAFAVWTTKLFLTVGGGTPAP